MCRLYGQISARAAPASDFLADSERSLLKQSDVRGRDLQKDGWGVAFYEGDRARVVKSPNPIFEEAGKFSALSARIRSKVVLGHIRAASNPRGVPVRRLIGRENTQPFTDGRVVFIHNGTLHIPGEVEKALGRWRRRVRGLNDSEVYFWQFMKFLERCGDPSKALEACVREIWAIWGSVKAGYPGRRAPHAGLNAVVSDGRSLHALCLYPRRGPGRPSLYNPRQAWGAMSLGRRNGRVIVASEDLDSRGWDHLAEGEIVSAVLSADGVSTRRRRLEPPA